MPLQCDANQHAILNKFVLTLRFGLGDRDRPGRHLFGVSPTGFGILCVPCVLSRSIFVSSCS